VAPGIEPKPLGTNPVGAPSRIIHMARNLFPEWVYNVKSKTMSVENFVDVVVFLIKITFAAGILALVLKVASEIFKSKNDK
jgi:hypothetical protein